ncbi:MAG: hypothetical protein AB7L65_02495 [Hyphomonadaceae bacterium]
MVRRQIDAAGEKDMIETKLKLWRSAGVTALISAGALGLANCSPPSTETSETATAEASGEAGEAAIGETGGEAGEAGIANVFTGLEGPALKAARLQQLKAFVLVGRQVAEGNTGEEAGILVSQGLLEVFTAHEADFAGFNPAAVRAAENLAGLDRAAVAQRLDAAANSITQAQGGLNANPADLASRMIDISTGLYQHVNRPDFVDPTEYQHSLGAALAARDALTRGEAALRAQNAARYTEALNELNRFIALWPGATAPETPATNQQVLAQASRVKLALSSFL